MSAAKKKIREDFRNSVFKRDNFKCKMCGAPNDLDAHHINDRSLMPNGGYVRDNGISVCPSCHIKAEEFHITGKAPSGWTPDDLYKKIGSSYQKALDASKRLCNNT